MVASLPRYLLWRWFAKSDVDDSDLINESIRGFSFDGRVGANGNMACSDSLNEQASVDWGIYHS